MKRLDPSVFPANPDNVREGNEADSNFGFLLIATVAMVGFLSALAELLTLCNWRIPHLVSMAAGLMLGLVIGAGAARSLHSPKSTPES